MKLTTWIPTPDSPLFITDVFVVNVVRESYSTKHARTIDRERHYNESFSTKG